MKTYIGGDPGFCLVPFHNDVLNSTNVCLLDLVWLLTILANISVWLLLPNVPCWSLSSQNNIYSLTA